MFLVTRKEKYSVKILGKTIEYVDKHTKRYLDRDFIPIIDYISSKGLRIETPTVLDGWDATFIHKKLLQSNTNLGKAGDDLALFLYMRLDKSRPVWIEQKGLFVLNET